MTITLKTLLKRELKDNFSLRKNNKKDPFGLIFSLVMTILLAVAFAYIFYEIVNTYVHVKINMQFNVSGRAVEILTCFYAFAVVCGTFFGIEKMRKMLILDKQKNLFLRLPIKESDLFISKLCTLYLSQLFFMATLIIPINIMLGVAIEATIGFWLLSILIVFLLPTLPFMFSALFVFPYAYLIRKIQHHYVILGIIYTCLLIVAFLFYNTLLGIFQSLLETGNIRYLFNEETVTTIQSISSVLYPTRCYASIMLEKNILISIIIIVLTVVIGLTIAYLLSKKLFYKMLYYENNEYLIAKPKPFKEIKINKTLLKSEFTNVLRHPNYTFQYFSISIAMPLMVYCCVTLFNSLISSTLGFSMHFEIGITVMLAFSVLTNTFCASNISRDGLTFLKNKTLPLKATTIINSKVFFCLIVSGLSVILSAIVVLIALDINLGQFFVILLVSLLFSVSQILLATKMDLCRPSFEKESKMATKVVFIGLILALLMGIGIIVIKVYFDYLKRQDTIIHYLLISILTLLYGGFTCWYYQHNLENKYYQTTK